MWVLCWEHPSKIKKKEQNSAPKSVLRSDVSREISTDLKELYSESMWVLYSDDKREIATKVCHSEPKWVFCLECPMEHDSE